MTTKDRYLASYTPGIPLRRPIECLADFIEAAVAGADIFRGDPAATVSWHSTDGGADFEVLNRLGWKCGTDYPRYGLYPFTVWSPFTEQHEATQEEAER